MEPVPVDAPKYLIVKYIPDLQRMEPRNIGVIVCSPRGVSARFMAEKLSSPGEVDGRSVPRFVTSVGAYKLWIEYWRSQLVALADCCSPTAGQPSVNINDLAAALAATSRGNFVVEEAGVFLDPIDSSRVTDAADFLYGTLVANESPDEPVDLTLDSACDRLITVAGLKSDPHFKARYPVDIPLAPDTIDRLEFSYAYKNGFLRLYQRVPLAGPMGAIVKNVHNSAWMFEKAISHNIVSLEHSASLVYLTEEQREDRDIGGLLNVLGHVTRVVDVSDQDLALRELSPVPA